MEREPGGRGLQGSKRALKSLLTESKRPRDTGSRKENVCCKISGGNEDKRDTMHCSSDSLASSSAKPDEEFRCRARLLTSSTSLGHVSASKSVMPPCSRAGSEQRRPACRVW